MRAKRIYVNNGGMCTACEFQISQDGKISVFPLSEQEKTLSMPLGYVQKRGFPILEKQPYEAMKQNQLSQQQQSVLHGLNRGCSNDPVPQHLMNGGQQATTIAGKNAAF